jgi:hypothetical protein
VKPGQFLLRRGVLILALFVVSRSLPAVGDEPSDDPVNVMLLYSGDLFVPAAIVQDMALRQALITGTSDLRQKECYPEGGDWF